MEDTFVLILLLPLIGASTSFLFGKYLKTITGYVSSLCILASFILSISIFLNYQENNISRDFTEIITLFNWLNLYDLNFSFSYQIDQLSLYMLLIVTGIGSLIHFYSIGYMSGEAGFCRFFIYLNLFVFAMLNLVLSDNLVLMFFGWEGVGLCSYLLIGFDYYKNKSIDAGNKAFITNRIGDLAILVGIILLYTLTDTVTYQGLIEEFSINANLKDMVFIIATCFFIGTLAKSAQVPLYVWLPDAMAGPTPVSALIHAATMVTAGIYLIVRLNFIFIAAVDLNMIIACIGAFTALFAATIALRQDDIKKVLAYSTVSQLGYMFLALGSGAYVAALFHLMTHAFFKALLFLGAGSVIHAMSGEQSIYKMGGLRKHMKITHITFLIATLAISGFPLLSGFFSKDLILEETFVYSPFLWLIGIITAVFTSFYMFRLLFLVFYGEERMDDKVKAKIHESPFVMTVPLLILAIGSAIAGLFEVSHLFIDRANVLHYFFEPIFFDSKIIIERFNILLPQHHLEVSTQIILMLVAMASCFSGLIFAYFCYIKRQVSIRKEEGIFKVLYNKYYIDEFCENFLIFPLRVFSKFLYKRIDRGLVDAFFLRIVGCIQLLSRFFARIQSGFVGDYVIMFCIGFLFILSILFLKGF